MIIDPDFPDHWKTRMLVDLLDGDEAAPIYLIRIWAHCQNRRIASFENLPPAALKALCRYPGHSNKLESALATSGFVRRDGLSLYVCGWQEYNASLIANWTNGKLGGRPKKKPMEKPEKTHGIPMENPNETDKIGLDGIGLEIPPTPQGGKREKTDNLPTSPQAIRISELFHRRPSTRWSDKEIRAFKAIPREAMDHLDIVCRYTESERLKGEQGRHRRDLATFLNNFTGELDRARATPMNGKSKTTSAAQYGI